MGGFSQYTAQQDERRNWLPIIIGAVAVVAIIALVVALNRGARNDNAQAGPVLYAENLQISNLKMSTANNFVGASVTYVEGKVANTGARTVTAANVEAIFRNSMGEVVDRQTQPLRVSTTQLGHPDWVGLSDKTPLQPNANMDFRLTFEHISADWNQGYPELRFTSLTAK